MGTAAVTGAFSYTGQYIARTLLDEGWRVRTLTRHPNRPHALQGSVPAFPLDFTKPADLIKALTGAEVLVNTYWVRYDYPGSSFSDAVANTKILLDCARQAGVRRVVHLSVSKPQNSQLPYFHGKWDVEKLVEASGLSYSILRPTIIFGDEEVLINNITWLLRRSPLFAVPGNGLYRVQPVFVQDLARLAAGEARRDDNRLLDAAGPEIYSFMDLLKLLKQAVGSRCLLLGLPAGLALVLARGLSALLGDIMLTNDELAALMEERLVVGADAAGVTRFSEWARSNAAHLGARYTNELVRHHGKGQAS